MQTTARQSVPAPKALGWLAMICSMRELPLLGKPTTKMGVSSWEPIPPDSACAMAGSLLWNPLVKPSTKFTSSCSPQFIQRRACLFCILWASLCEACHDNLF